MPPTILPQPGDPASFLHTLIANVPTLDNRQWNALIGIITAIVGNVLISFALNIQRYAHIRLNRDKLRRAKSWRTATSKSAKVDGNGTKSKGYGTQLEMARERAEMNARAPEMEEGEHEHGKVRHGNETEDGHANGEGVPGGISVGRNSDRTDSEATMQLTKEQSEEEERFQRQSYLKSPYWWAGILLMTMGEAGNFLAYGFAPASIVSPLGVVALVSNCIIAPVLLKERFRKRDFWGVVIAVGGAVTVVLSAKTSEGKMGPDDVWQAITRWEFELYLGITAGLIALLMWLSGKYGEKTIIIDLGLAGLFGGYTALSTKGVASLLSDTLWRALTFPITYLLIVILIVTAVFQIRYVNRALQNFDSTRVVPTQFVTFTLSVIIGSAVLYREFESANAERVAKFIGGCALTFLGVYFITSGDRGRSGLDDESEDDDPEGGAIQLVDEEGGEEGITMGHEDDMTFRRRSSVHDSTPRATTQRNGASFGGRQSPPRTPPQMHSNASSASYANSTEGVSPFSEDPRNDSSRKPDLRPNPGAIASAPKLPSQAMASRSRPTTPTRQSGSNSNLLYPHPHPAEPHQRARLLSRESVSHMLPGPISSPLLSSLSAIVADELRKEMDRGSVKARNSFRRRLTRERNLRGQEPEEAIAEVDVERERDRVRDPVQEGERQALLGQVKKGRSHSISGALGGLFKHSPKNKGSEGNVDGSR